MIAIIDYAMGNLRSVENALLHSGAKDTRITSSAKDLDKADKIILPGVGAMADAMKALDALSLIQAIKRNVFRKPFLGICLGLQLLFEKSQEGLDTAGLGILKGNVLRFKESVKIPHIGWNNIKYDSPGEAGDFKNQALLKDIPDNSYFYFCHSYYVSPEDESLILSRTYYGIEFASLIRKDNLFACQFHPEKSQDAGLRLLKNFVEL